MRASPGQRQFLRKPTVMQQVSIGTLTVPKVSGHLVWLTCGWERKGSRNRLLLDRNREQDNAEVCHGLRHPLAKGLRKRELPQADFDR